LTEGKKGWDRCREGKVPSSSSEKNQKKRKREGGRWVGLNNQGYFLTQGKKGDREEARHLDYGKITVCEGGGG